VIHINQAGGNTRLLLQKGFIMSQYPDQYTYCLSKNGVDDEWCIFAPGAERPFASIPFWNDPHTTSFTETQAMAARLVASLNLCQHISTETLIQCSHTSDLPAFLASRREIAIIWCIEDIKEIRPDLNDDQAWIVLQRVRHQHDAGIGINWEMLELTAQHLFGDKPEDGLKE
jgi:hypothetical protein